MSTELATLKSYEAMLPTRGGGLTRQPKYRYMSGEPFVYKFNGSSGQILDADNEPIMSNGQRLKELIIQPIAFRFFNDCLFGRKEKDAYGKETLNPKFEDWCEVFFVDENNRVCVIMFAGTTLASLKRAMKGLYYDPQGRTMNEIVLQMTPEKVTSKNDSSVSWHQGNFKWKAADEKLIAEYTDFDRDFPVYQSSTVTGSCQLQSFHGSFFEKMSKGEVSTGTQDEEVPEEAWSEPAAPASGFGQASSSSDPLPF